jgi:hypothetical protein
MASNISLVDCFAEKRPSAYFDESNSDKTGVRHDYGNLYDWLFSSLLFQNGMQPIRVLEIGVTMFGEGSGHAFAKMPFVEKFVGLDKNPVHEDFGEKGVFLNVDAYTEHGLQSAARYAPYHLLIDDAEHIHDQQVAFFTMYTPLCATPGIMICEDVPRITIAKRLKAIRDPSLLHIRVPGSLIASKGKLDNNVLLKTNIIGLTQ